MKESLKYETIEELIYWSYANLAMAHSAVMKDQEKYGTINYVIRAKLFKGLKEGTMNIRTIFDDEKVKLKTGQFCNYCGSSEHLTLDHILPQKLGGKDDAENLIYSCRKCNSSKGKKDLMLWMTENEKFLPLMVIRRYLKLVMRYCAENNLLKMNINDPKYLSLPFRLDHLPIKYPKPNELILSVNHNNE